MSARLGRTRTPIFFSPGHQGSGTNRDDQEITTCGAAGKDQANNRVLGFRVLGFRVSQLLVKGHPKVPAAFGSFFVKTAPKKHSFGCLGMFSFCQKKLFICYLCRLLLLKTYSIRFYQIFLCFPNKNKIISFKHCTI